MASKLKSPSKKQLPSKNFMTPTISAANKTSFPKKKILAERNQTLDVVEQQTSPVSKAVKFPVIEAEDDVKPYDPIKNYLSPRPKFLRYNPDRRREIFVQSSSSSLDSGVTSSGLEVMEDSSGSTDSCSKKVEQESVEEAKDLIHKDGEDDTGSFSKQESVKEAKDMIDEDEDEDEDEDDEEDEIEEEMAEFGEDKGCILKGFLKFLVVVIALISTTKAICSMNSPTFSSHTLESVWGFKDWSNVHGFNFSGVGDPIRESDLMAGRLKEEEVFHGYQGLDSVEPIEELVEELQELEDPENEVENDETDVIQDADQLQLIENLQEDGILESQVLEIHEVEAEIEVLDQDFNQDGVLDDIEILESEVVEIHEVEAEIEVLDQDFNQDGVLDDIETAKDMDDELETRNVSIGFTGFDPILAILIGFSVLILASFGVVYHSRWMKTKPSSPVATTVAANENLMAEKEEIKNLEPSPSSIQPLEEELLANFATLVVDPRPKDVSKKTSGVNAPTVELLGEFVFGREVTNSSFRSNDTKSDTISPESQAISGQTRSSRNTAEKMVKKPRRKIAEVTPSPVRRSNRIQSRTSAVVSP